MTDVVHAASRITPKVSVIVPVRNDSNHLRLCLAALRKSTDQRFEVIVIDDASAQEIPSAALIDRTTMVRLEQPGGPAVARNRGAELAAAQYLFFLDADVCAHPDAIERVIRLFDENEKIDAVFGSYDLTPGAPNLISQYKNLSHRFVHQHAAEEAGTFWTGCGAIRKSVFLELGGFDTSHFRLCIEDIELGARLKRGGRRIRLDKKLQGTHLKVWSLWGLVKCDVLVRGIPWTRLILRERDLPRDLNLSRSQRASAAFAIALMLLLVLTARVAPMLPAAAAFSMLTVFGVDLLTARTVYGSVGWQLALCTGAVLLSVGVAAAIIASGRWGLATLLLVAVVVGLNRSYYAFFIRQRGVAFAIMIVPLHLLYYLYSAAALLSGIVLHLCSRDKSLRTITADRGKWGKPQNTGDGWQDGVCG